MENYLSHNFINVNFNEIYVNGIPANGYFNGNFYGISSPIHSDYNFNLSVVEGLPSAYSQYPYKYVDELTGTYLNFYKSSDSGVGMDYYLHDTYLEISPRYSFKFYNICSVNLTTPSEFDMNDFMPFHIYENLISIDIHGDKIQGHIVSVPKAEFYNNSFSGSTSITGDPSLLEYNQSAVDFFNMYSGCRAISYNAYTPNSENHPSGVFDCSYMYNYCRNLSGVDNSLHLRNLNNTSYMFNECTKIDCIPYFSKSDSSFMYYNCRVLGTEHFVSNTFDIIAQEDDSDSIDISYTWANCPSMNHFGFFISNSPSIVTAWSNSYPWFISLEGDCSSRFSLGTSLQNMSKPTIIFLNEHNIITHASSWNLLGPCDIDIAFNMTELPDPVTVADVLGESYDIAIAKSPVPSTSIKGTSSRFIYKYEVNTEVTVDDVVPHIIYSTARLV